MVGTDWDERARRLLNVDAQEAYYRLILNRYAQFCRKNADDLSGAFNSLPRSASGDATTNPPVSFSPKTEPKKRAPPPPSQELSVILIALRKLREAIVATTGETPAALWQEVHTFCVRTALLAGHPPSYYPSLERALHHNTPLSEAATREFVSYLILDYACRQGDISSALRLREKAKAELGFEHELIEYIFSALIHDNWILFWETRERGDGYIRALMDWALDSMQLRALKAIGKSYLTVDLRFLIKSCTGEEDGCTWEALVSKFGLGWRKEDDKIIIRARKPAITTPEPAAA